MRLPGLLTQGKDIYATNSFLLQSLAACVSYILVLLVRVQEGLVSSSQTASFPSLFLGAQRENGGRRRPATRD